jgi:hypothetical protein
MRHPILELLEGGSVPASQISDSIAAILKPLMETRAITRERAGAGWRLVLHNPDALRSVLASQAPGFLEGVDPTLGPKGQAIVRTRNAHAAGPGEADLVILKARDGIWLEGPEGQRMDAGELTRLAGALAIVIKGQGGWRFYGTGPVNLATVNLATVENSECFLRAESLEAAADVWIYTQGRLTRRVLAWLHSLAETAATLVHLGDYDPVGIDEYRRLREGWGDRVSLFMPDGLERLFETRGNREIMTRERNQDVLGRLLAQRDTLPADAREVMRLIQIHGAGLEQEALLIATMGSVGHQGSD